jgi:hypothetical protein
VFHGIGDIRLDDQLQRHLAGIDAAITTFAGAYTKPTRKPQEQRARWAKVEAVRIDRSHETLTAYRITHEVIRRNTIERHFHRADYALGVFLRNGISGGLNLLVFQRGV